MGRRREIERETAEESWREAEKNNQDIINREKMSFLKKVKVSFGITLL